MTAECWASRRSDQDKGIKEHEVSQSQQSQPNKWADQVESVGLAQYAIHGILQILAEEEGGGDGAWEKTKIERHLSSDKHREVAARDRRPIAEAVRALQGILRTQHQLDDFAFPEPTCGPIPALGPPWTDGVACDGCRYIVRSVKKMKEHCRKKHGWVNSRDSEIIGDNAKTPN
ncbi:hypothetical protein G7054_g12416 [Neopestalotiopsis clavispora]|nr:hypothetical protein G7054_g12416 [Neopestalotiopsis clavispora]